MCGRYALFVTPHRLAEHFGLDSLPSFPPRYNIAPGQEAPVILTEAEKRSSRLLRWGLIPGWAEDERIGNRMINARIETADVRPAFRRALWQRRCIVPASGFYEWQRRNHGKQPYFIARPNGLPMGMAGLWATWQRGERRIESFAILTRPAVGPIAAIHARMPVILPEDLYPLWLGERFSDPTSLCERLAKDRPNLIAYPVSPAVNRPVFDSPDCVQPISEVAIQSNGTPSGAGRS